MTRKQRRAAADSQSRAQAARANGAKSHGPVTAEGKAKSAQSGFRHGAFSSTILLETESREQLEALVNGYVADYAPHNDSQLKIIYRMAAATWRQQRAEGVETALINEKMHEQYAALVQQSNTPDISPAVRTGAAMADLYSQAGRLKAVQNAIDLCQRQFSRALRDLDRAQKMNAEPKPFACPEDRESKPEPAPAAQPEPPSPAPEQQKPEPEPKHAEPAAETPVDTSQSSPWAPVQARIDTIVGPGCVEGLPRPETAASKKR